jgi:2-hydroxychromene-2-carboxylate isomerase
VFLGVVFKQTGALPLTQIPLKGDYSRRDMERSAKFHGIADFRMPSKFPIPSQAAARIVLWAQQRDAAVAARVVHALYHAFFTDDRDISDPDIAVAVAATCGVDAAAARAAIDDPAIKDALKRANDDAIARGVFGSPSSSSTGNRSGVWIAWFRWSAGWKREVGEVATEVATAVATPAAPEYTLYCFAQSGNCYKPALAPNSPGPIGRRASSIISAARRARRHIARST